MSSAPKLKDLYKSLINDMSKDAAGFEPLSKLAEMIHRPPGEIILLSVILAVTLTVFDIGCDFFLIVLGCSYAGFMSLRVHPISLLGCRKSKFGGSLPMAYLLAAAGFYSVIRLAIPCSSVLHPVLQPLATVCGHCFVLSKEWLRPEDLPVIDTAKGEVLAQPTIVTC
jgi:hypothetical protein